MSEVMQQGILRMPPECWMNGEPLDERQRYSAYVAAADRILELETENAALRKEKDKLELERCEMLRSWDLTINHNAALVEAFAKAEVLWKYAGRHGEKEFAYVSGYFYPGEIIVFVDRAVIDAARKEAKP